MYVTKCKSLTTLYCVSGGLMISAEHIFTYENTIILSKILKNAIIFFISIFRIVHSIVCHAISLQGKTIFCNNIEQ